MNETVAVPMESHASLEIDRRAVVVSHRDVIFRGTEAECRKFMVENTMHSRLTLFKPVVTMAPRRRMETVIDETDLRKTETPPVKRTWSHKKKITNGRRKKK